MNYDVCISYSRADSDFVVQFDEFLRNAGATTWLDQRNLRPGQKWENVIEDEIPKARMFLTCLSAAGLDKRGYFHVEQQLAVKAAMRIPSDQLFIIPVLLGECELPRDLRQYHSVSLTDPGAIELLPLSISDAVERKITASADAIAEVRNALVGHLHMEAASNEEFERLFARTNDISWQDSANLIERIANSREPKRLEVLLRLRSHADISYAEQAALDLAIENVKQGRRTSNLQRTIADRERANISKMGILGNALLTMQMQVNKYARYIARKNTEPYRMAEAKILELLELGLSES